MTAVSMDALLKLASKWMGKKIPPGPVGLSAMDSIKIYEANKKSANAVLEKLKFQGCFSPDGLMTGAARLISTTDTAASKNDQDERGQTTMAKKAYDSDYMDSLDRVVNALELLVDSMTKDDRRNARHARDADQDADLIPVDGLRGRTGFNPVTHTDDDRSYENLLKYYRGRSFMDGKKAADRAGASPSLPQRPTAHDYATAVDDVAADFETKARQMGESKRVINHRKKLL